MSRNTTRLPETQEGLIELYINRLKENKDMENRLKTTRVEFSSMRDEADRLEENLKSIQNTGQLIGEILKKIDSEKSKNIFVICSYNKVVKRTKVCCHL